MFKNFGDTEKYDAAFAIFSNYHSWFILLFKKYGKFYKTQKKKMKKK